MTNTTLHVDNVGSVPKPRTISPKAIQAQGQVWESLIRVIGGFLIVIILCCAYIYLAINKIEGAQSVLVVIGTGVGFLLGRGEKQNQNN